MAIPREGLSLIIPEFLSDCGFACDVTGPGTLQIITFRGCKFTAKDLRERPTVTDQYSDVMLAFGIKSGGQRFLECFRASARPGDYWVRHRDYRGPSAGCPTLQPGQYLYQRGDHRGHQAMIQAAQVCQVRDYDQDGRTDPNEALTPTYDRWRGTNIHAATTINVGASSSGCQVIAGGWGGAPWQTFHSLVYKAAGNQDLFRYTVVDYAMFCTWWNAPQDDKPQWIMYGSRGDDVLDEQEHLVLNGYLARNAVTGTWGPDTDIAWRRYQRKAQRMQVPDGIKRVVE